MFKQIFDFLISTDVSSDGTSYYPTVAGNIALLVVVFLLFLAMAVFSGSKKKMQTKQMVFSAMAMTLAVVTSFIKFAKLPYGGSITLFSMFFICLIGYLYGARVGILTGIAYGLLSLILDPMIMHPIQLLLDYPIAFGCLGLAGVFSNSKYGIIEGYILGVFGRYVCHLISGIVFFANYTPEGMNTVIYSLGYNATYIVPEAIATILILSIPTVRNALHEVKKMAIEN